MAITPYNKPADAPLMDTYVPIPFEDMKQAGAMAQGRYERDLSTQEDLGAQLSQFSGASSIIEPGTGRQVKLNDSTAVEAAKQSYYDQLDEIGSDMSQAGSPERRVKLMNLTKQIQRDQGGNGVFNKANLNKASIDNFNKMLRDNPKLANSPQALQFINRIRQYESEAADGKIKLLDLSGAPGEDFDVDKGLTDLLKNYGSKFAGHELTASNIPGLIQEMTASNISKADIQKTVKDYFQNNASARDQLQMQAQFDQVRGGDTSFEGLVNGYMGMMGDVFSENDVKFNSKWDPMATARAKKKLDEEEEMSNLLDFDLATFKPGSGIKNVKALDKAYNDVDMQVGSYKQKMLLDDNLKGIKVGEDGMPTDYMVDGIDKTDYIKKYYEDPIRLAKEKKYSLQEFEKRAKEETNYVDPINMSDEEIKDLPRYQEVYQSELTKAKRLGMQAGEKGARLEITADEQEKIALEKTKESIRSKAPNYKEYTDWIDKENKAGTFIAGVKPLKKTLSSNLEKHVLSNYANIDTSIGKMESLLTQNHGKVYNKADYDKISISAKTPPVFEGYTVDSKGDTKLAFTVMDKDGKPVDKIAIDAPASFTKDLFRTGDMDEFAYMVNAEISGETKSFGVLNDTQDISLDPYSYDGKYSSTNKEPMMKLRRDTANGDERIIGEIVVDGQPIQKTFNTKAELNTWVATYRKMKATNSAK